MDRAWEGSSPAGVCDEEGVIARRLRTFEEIAYRYDRAVELVTDIRAFALGLVLLVLPR